MRYELDARKLESEVQKSAQQMLDLASVCSKSNQAAVTLVLHCNDALRPINKLLEATNNADVRSIRELMLQIKVCATRISNMSAKEDFELIEKEIANIRALVARLLSFRVMPWEGDISEKALSRL